MSRSPSDAIIVDMFGTPRVTLGRRAGLASAALTIAMLGTTLPTPPYDLYRTVTDHRCR
jgi:hypothetical protein